MATLDDFGELSRAEREFGEACQAGSSCALGDARVPDPEDETRRIRGALIRFFSLGGSEETPLHERGIDLAGAVVTGQLDLTGVTRDCDLVLRTCTFRRRPELRGSHLRSVDLSGSHMPGLEAEGLVTDGALRLADGFEARATVRLVRARIGSDLDCSGGSFETPEGDALNADGADVRGSLFLMAFQPKASKDAEEEPPAIPFRCIGTARFVSATIGDSIQVLDAIFDSRARKYALNLAHARIRRQFTVKRLRRFDGRLNLAGASVYSLNDDPSEITAPRDLILNGFSYKHFSSKAPTGVGLRLEWLNRQAPEDYGQDFWAQPYGQLAKVYSEIGHEADAREVFVRRDTMQGKVTVRLAARDGDYLRMLRIWSSQQMMRWIIGYGYRPERALVTMVLIIALTALFFQRVWDEGAMTPAQAPVLMSADWQQAAAEHPNPAEVWSAEEGPGRDYETFSAVAYAFDLFVPLIDLGQNATWGPSTTRGPWGVTGWWLRWVVEIVGWLVTAVAAAAVTGLVRRG